jgi:hypothetical protein
MNLRTISLAIVTVAALSPSISNASEKASIKACASAFATSMASPGSSAPAYKLAYRSGFGSGISDFYPTVYTFTLEAHDPKSGASIARAVCSADSRGTVTALTATPVDANTTLAARN